MSAATAEAPSTPVTTTAATSTAATTDAPARSDDAVLRDILRSEKSADKPATNDAVADKPADGQADPNAKPDESAETKADTAADKPETKDQPATDPARSERIARAINTLRLDNVDEEMLQEAVAKSPEKVIAWAERAGKRHAEVSRRLHERAKGEPSKPEAAAETRSEIDYDALVKPFAADMSAESVDQMKKLAKTLSDNFAAREQKLTEAFDAKTADVNARVARIQIESAKNRLVERFPQLSNPRELDPESTSNVFEMMTLLEGQALRRGESPTIDTLMERACRIQFNEQAIEAAAAKRAETDRKRSNGSMTVTTTTQPPKPMTHAEREDASIRAIMRGETPAE